VRERERERERSFGKSLSLVGEQVSITPYVTSRNSFKAIPLLHRRSTKSSAEEAGGAAGSGGEILVGSFMAVDSERARQERQEGSRPRGLCVP